MTGLTSQEQEHLELLESKLDHIGDAVMGIVKHFHTGLFLYGEGGTGKSYKVLETLRALQAKYVYHNTRLTARRLVDALERAPSDIHFIEDAETLLDDKKSFGVLRAALWSQSRKKPPEREITWTAFKTNIRFIFTGGIIVISNVNLAEEIPEIRAIKTRINVLRLDLTAEELLRPDEKALPGRLSIRRGLHVARRVPGSQPIHRCQARRIESPSRPAIARERIQGLPSVEKRQLDQALDGVIAGSHQRTPLGNTSLGEEGCREPDCVADQQHGHSVPAKDRSLGAEDRPQGGKVVLPSLETIGA